MIISGMYRVLNTLLMLWVLMLPARAETGADLKALMTAIDVPGTIAVMREEGVRFGNDVANDLLIDVNPDVWQETVARIYDPAKMERLITDGLRVALEGVDLSPMLAFYTSETGAEIVSLEITARRAFLDPDTEAAAAESYQEMLEKDAFIIEQINTLITDSDLVERNVMGALNSDMMFYRGMVEGGAFEMTEAEILSDIWAQEEDLRLSSRDWLRSFLLVSYQPLEEGKLEDYIAFWRTQAGKELNRAIFVAYDQMYEEISYLMGLAVAQEMMSQKL